MEDQIAVDSNSSHVGFPPEFVSPERKESADYGLHYAKAIYSCGTRYGMRTYNDTSEWDRWTELAQGRESVDWLRNLFGFSSDINDQNDPTASLAYIDVNVLNLAPKYINRAVDKMMKYQYDIGLQAIDPVSIDEKKDYAASLQAFYTLKKWMKDMDYNPQVLFPDLDVAALPEFPDELLYDIAVNPKIKAEIAGELLMKLIHYTNRSNQKMREVDWDLVTYGLGHIHCYDDANGFPREDRINGKYWFGSCIDNEDFEDQEYNGFFDFISVNQFIKETSEQLTQEQQQEIVRRHCDKNTHDIHVDHNRGSNYDGLGYIPVMRFYFRSEDNRTFVEKTSEFGRPYLVEKAHNYRPPANAGKSQVDTGEYNIIKNTYTSVYGGTWVIDSNCIYNYKRQNYPRQNLVNASTPIKTFATNFKDGRAVSFLSQMIEPLKMINIAWNKIKQILAEERMGVMEIDFDQIQNVAIGKAGKQWTPHDVMRFFFKKRILVKRGITNKHDQKVGNAVDMNVGGLQLADYMNSLTLGIQMLEQMTNSSVVESMNQPDRLAVKNAMLSQATSDLDMAYLFNAHEYLYQRTSHQLLLIAQGSLASGKIIEGLVPSLGKVNLAFFTAPERLAYCEYGMIITRQPGPEEWANFMMRLEIALKDGRLDASDIAYLEELDNLKQARQMMAIREKIFKRKTREENALAFQQQADVNAQAAEQSLQNELRLIQEKGKIDAALLELEGQIKSRLQNEVDRNTFMTKRLETQSKQSIGRTAANTEVVKAAVKNIPEKAKNLNDMAQLDIDREKNEIDREKVKVMAKKPAAKK
jgi:hypothetical protein